MEATLRSRFAAGPEGSCRLHQQLDYTLRKSGPLNRITDFLFIRSQLRGSLQRSLNAFGPECEDRTRA
jgi:hypothetical protein